MKFRKWLHVKAQEYARKTLQNEFTQMENLLSIRKMSQVTGPVPNTRGWAASPDFILLCLEYIKKTGAKTIVELGCGASTIYIKAFILNTLYKSNAKLISIEDSEVFEKKTREALKNCDLNPDGLIQIPINEDTGFYNIGAHFDVLNEKIDILIIDGPRNINGEARASALKTFLPYLGARSHIIVDDASRDSKMISDWAQNPYIESCKFFDLEKGAAVLEL